MKLVKATIIVPAYNAEKELDACLDSLVNQQTIPFDTYEIIVIDDASADRTAEIARKYPVQLVSDGIKRGKSGTRNHGAQLAQGEILLFTDSDCIPTSNWVETMIAPFEVDPELVGVKGVYLCNQASSIAQFIQSEHEEKYEQMAQFSTTNFIDTYSAGFRRNIFLEYGGFDMQLTFSMVEDQEFSFRLAADDHKMIFIPEAKVYHQHVTTFWKYCERKFWIASWKALIVKRHPERFKSDTRTPQTLKYQMLLILGGFLLLPVTLAIAPLRKAWLGWMGAFLVTCVPFMRFVLPRNSSASAVALPTILGRAIALTLGYIHGSLKWRGGRLQTFLKNTPSPLSQLL